MLQLVLALFSDTLCPSPVTRPGHEQRPRVRAPLPGLRPLCDGGADGCGAAHHKPQPAATELRLPGNAPRGGDEAK